jgi:multiple sugar transport system substrate-binding protein
LATLASLAVLVGACSGGTASAPTSPVASSGEVSVAPSTASASPVTLTLQRFFGSCDDKYGTVTDTTKTVGECGEVTVLINKFNAENGQGITIQPRVVEWAQNYDVLNTAFAAGDPPDIFIVHRSRLADYVGPNLAAPLDDIFAKAGIDPNDFIPFAREGLTYSGKIYAEPFDLNGLLWHMNLDVLEKSGLLDASGQPVLPTSPDELFAQAAKVQAATNLPYFCLATNGDNMPLNLATAWVSQQGSKLFDTAGNVTIDTPEAAAAVNILMRLYKTGNADKTDTYQVAEQKFLAGKCAVIINGTWVVDAYIAAAKSGTDGLKRHAVVSLPTLFKQPGTWADEHSWGVSAKAAADPAKANAVGVFLKFLKDNSLAWAGGTGHLSPFKSTVASAEYAALPQRSGYASTAEIEADAIPPVKHYQSIVTAMREALESVIQGQSDTAGGLKQAQDAVATIFSQQ